MKIFAFCTFIFITILFSISFFINFNMNVTIPKYYAGTKAVTIYDPSFFKGLIDSGLYTAIITPLKIAKDGAVMYTLSLRDNNKNILLDVQIGLPEEMTNTVKLSASNETNQGLIPVWETNDSTSEIFKRDVGRLLESWLLKIQTANTLSEEVPIIYLPQSSTELKWPWKVDTTLYFENFDRLRNTHVLRIGVGYYSAEKNYVGVTLQLSNYPGKTILAISDARKSSNKKRKKAEVDNVTDENVQESTDV